jgi:putative IMPACT (imprinted ancient) family translation regulator
MLNVLMHADVSFVVAAVARIFGGTKLGTGGLARAYGGAVSEGMALLETEVQRLLTDARFSVPYAFEAQMHHLLQKHQGELQAVQYAEHVEAAIQIEEAKLEDFTTDLRNACGGQSERLKLD